MQLAALPNSELVGTTAVGTTTGGTGGQMVNTGPSSGITTTNNTGCPCRIDRKRAQKYLVDTPQPGSIPVQVEETGWVCEEPTTRQTRVLCEETNAANSGTLNDCTGYIAPRRAYSLAEASSVIPGLDVTGGVNVGPTPAQSETPWLLIGGVAAAAIVGTYLVTKKGK